MIITWKISRFHALFDHQSINQSHLLIWTPLSQTHRCLQEIQWNH